jgi:hypothetical protein
MSERDAVMMNYFQEFYIVISNQISFKERNQVFAVRVSILGMVISRRL